MKHIDYEFTRGMDDAEITERLRTTQTGVLCLARNDDAYAVPIAHHYDDGHLYFRLGRTNAGRKQAFLETTTTGCYVLYGTEPVDGDRHFDSWSIIITGTLTHLPAAEYDRFDTAELNHRFAPIRVFGEAIEDIEIVIAEFDIDTITGRITLSQ